MTNEKTTSRSKITHRLCVSALCLAAGVLLPQLFHMAAGQAMGTVLLPMHIPALLCGLLCGWPWGAAIGFLAPLISSLLTAMPVMFPQGISMMGELCVYGAVSGLLYRKVFGSGGIPSLYASLIAAMIAGRCVSGLIKWALLLGTDAPFTMQAFLSSALLAAWPGILLQLILLPVLVLTLRKAGVLRKI